MRIESSLVPVLRKVSGHNKVGHLLIGDNHLANSLGAYAQFHRIVLWKQRDRPKGAGDRTASFKNIGDMSIQEHIGREAGTIGSKDTDSKDWFLDIFRCFVVYLDAQILTWQKPVAFSSLIILQENLLNRESIFCVFQRLTFLNRDVVEIVLDDFFSFPVLVYTPIFEPDTSLAQASNGIQIVTDKQHGSSGLCIACNFCEAFLLEGSVANRQYLIHDQHLRIKVGGDRECQP